MHVTGAGKLCCSQGELWWLLQVRVKLGRAKGAGEKSHHDLAAINMQASAHVPLQAPAMFLLPVCAASQQLYVLTQTCALQSLWYHLPALSADFICSCHLSHRTPELMCAVTWWVQVVEEEEEKE
jgi:hypothetical protein